MKTTVRAELGEQAFAQTWAQGQPIMLDLTEREVEVLRLVARGLSDAEVAQALIISPRTVNAHLHSIYSKLNIPSRNAATHFALAPHLI